MSKEIIAPLVVIASIVFIGFNCYSKNYIDKKVEASISQEK